MRRVRHLQRSGSGRVVVGVSKKVKRVRVRCLTNEIRFHLKFDGMCSLLRSYAQAAFENIALWHERDISHSSVERLIAPDATILFHYSLGRFHSLLKELEVNEKKVFDRI